MEVINCTPHTINVVCGEEKREYPASGVLPRVATIETVATGIAGIPCITSELGNVEGLPEEKPDTFYIVSGMVFSASNRKDLIAPDTGKSCIRENGQIVAITRFIRKEAN